MIAATGAAMPDLPVAAPPDRPVLIAGPTASGKSALATAIAAAQGRTVVNADALQVFEGWPILTAQPGVAEWAAAAHALYAHRPVDAAYSVGGWLRDLGPYLQARPAPVVVGGTGLYFAALTEGLAEMPSTRPEIRAEAQARLHARGLPAMALELDPETRAGLDVANPRRVLRAWEVARQTGRSLASWKARTGPPLLPLVCATAFLLAPGRDWLAARIDRRFEAMLAAGALDEAGANLAGWDPARQSSQAIGAAQLIAHLRGEMPLEEAVAAAKIASRRYAKRQRSWGRSRGPGWIRLDPAAIGGL